MAGERTLPNLGITQRWTLGSNGWGPGMDTDFVMLDTLLFLTVKSASTAAPPSSPTAGDRYIVAAGATGAWAGNVGKVALYLDTAWTFLTPKAGFAAWVQDQNYTARFDGTNWLVRSDPYDIQAYRHRLPQDATEPLLSIMLTRAVLFPAAFAGSLSSARGAPVAAQTLNVYKNATIIGTVNFAAGASIATFTLTAATLFATGDLFEVYASATPDPAFSGLRLAFAGNR